MWPESGPKGLRLCTTIYYTLFQGLLGILFSSLEDAHEDDKEEEEYDSQDGSHDPHKGRLLGVGQAAGIVAVVRSVAGLRSLRWRS